MDVAVAKQIRDFEEWLLKSGTEVPLKLLMTGMTGIVHREMW